MAAAAAVCGTKGFMVCVKKKRTDVKVRCTGPEAENN